MATGSHPGTNEPDGQFDSQDMPTTDGQMASNTSEEVVPPSADRPADSPTDRPTDPPTDPPTESG